MKKKARSIKFYTMYIMRKLEIKMEFGNKKWTILLILTLLSGCQIKTVRYLSPDMLHTRTRYIDLKSHKRSEDVAESFLYLIEEIFNLRHEDFPDFTAVAGFYTVKSNRDDTATSCGLFFDNKDNSLFVIKKLDANLFELHKSIIDFPNTPEIRLLIESKTITRAYRVSLKKDLSQLKELVYNTTLKVDKSKRPMILDGVSYYTFYSDPTHDLFSYFHNILKNSAQKGEIAFAELIRLYKSLARGTLIDDF